MKQSTHPFPDRKQHTTPSGGGSRNRAKLPSVLVVDDDPAIRMYLHRNLLAAGYRVIDVDSCDSALACVARQPPDLLIVSLDLPANDSLACLRAIRKISSLPIVALSTLADEGSLVNALEMGADDYITKPFGMGEVLARCQAVLRRVLVHRRVISRGREQRFSSKPFQVLRVLVENADKVLSREELLGAVWGPERTNRAPYLRTAIRELRRKIEVDPAHPVHIVTEVGLGYRLKRQLSFRH